jgi:hypothetical protein
LFPIENGCDPDWLYPASGTLRHNDNTTILTFKFRPPAQNNGAYRNRGALGRKYNFEMGQIWGVLVNSRGTT